MKNKKRTLALCMAIAILVTLAPSVAVHSADNNSTSVLLEPTLSIQQINSFFRLNPPDDEITVGPDILANFLFGDAGDGSLELMRTYRDGKWGVINEAGITVIPMEYDYIGTINATDYEMFVCVGIADTGRGVREEDLPKLFVRFWRAEESAALPGVGIGLYLAREIITACGGYIKVSSEVGKGSIFSVFLSKV